MAALSARPAWEGYAYATEADHFAWWCEANLVQSADPFAGMPLVLEGWQLQFMGEALAVGEDLRPVWRSVALVVGRKNGKTALLAAYALYRLLHDEGQPEILLAAASDRNAGRLFEAVVGYARRNPALAEQLHLREYIGEIARVDGGGKILRLAHDPDALDGYNPSLVVCDELHAWRKPSHRKAWAKLTTAGGSRSFTQVFTITVAGEAAERADSILGRLVDGNEAAGECERKPGLTISRNRPGATLIYNHSAPTTEPGDVRALKLANPASWVTLDYLRRQADNPELTAAEVLQFHGCVWAVGERTWIDPAIFAGLANRRRRVDAAAEVVLAFDGAYSRDSTALVGATVEERPHVWVEQVWERPPAQPSWRTPRLEVEAALADAMERYVVLELAPDPPGWHREVETWEETYGEVVVRFETNQPRRFGPACDDFEQAVRDGELSHDGGDALLRHLSNCVPVRRGAFTVVTKESHDSPRKIDVAVGAIVAYHRARWLFTNREQDELGAMVFDVAAPR